MSVYLGAAHIDERGKATGGAAGDQTGKEVCKRKYYKHSKGWRVLVCTVPGAGDLIAHAMKSAIENDKIGYDQNQRSSLYNQVKSKGYDPAAAMTACETDCSALVRVCVQYAFEKLDVDCKVDDFYTANEASTLLKTGYFKELTGDKYTAKADYLPTGAILVTKSKGHTEVVLNAGDNAEGSPFVAEKETGARILRNGCEGADVKDLQNLLLQLGYDLGRFGCDGEFGDQTELAVRTFQFDAGITVDGEVGEQTIAAIMHALNKSGTSTPNSVQIVNGDCYVRSAPNTEGYKQGVVKRGTVLPYGGQMSVEGWYLVEYNNKNGWVSGKYAELVEV